MAETPQQLAQRLAEDEKHPRSWQYFLIDLLKAMEHQSAGTDLTYPKGYEEMLQSLRDAINDRLNIGLW